MRDLGVEVAEAAAAQRRQQLSDGGLAAARHPDEDVGAALTENRFQHASGRLRLDRTAEEQLVRAHGLHHQHRQPARGGEAGRARAADQLGRLRVEHDVEHAAQRGEARRVGGAAVVVGEHPDRCGVDQHLGFTQLVHRFVIQFAAARDGADIRSARLLRDGAHGLRGAARAENQHPPAAKRHVRIRAERRKAVEIGVVAGQSPVGAADDGVHRADAGGAPVYAIQQRQHGALVGDGDVDAVEIARGEEVPHRRFVQLDEAVVGIPQQRVNARRAAMAQPCADQPEAHSSEYAPRKLKVSGARSKSPSRPSTGAAQTSASISK